MKNYYFFVLLLLSFTACKEKIVVQSVDGVDQKTAVKIENIVLTSDAIPIESSGVVGTKSAMNLSFKLGGIINKVYVKESQHVHQGQVLAEVLSTEIDAGVRKATQGIEKAERDLERIKKMYADTVATIEHVEDLTTQLEVAKSDYEVALFNQKYTQIIAPVNGRIIKKFAQSNELVGPGMPVLRLAANDKNGFVLHIGIADKDIVKVKLNDRVEVRFDAYAGTLFEAYVSEIAESADPMSGAFPVGVTIKPQADKPLKNGFIGKVKLYPSNHRPYYKIDMSALVEGHNKYANIFVPVRRGETIVAQKTKVYPEYIGTNFFTLSESQLPGINQIITDGSAYLSDGMEIQEVQKNEVLGVSYKE